MKKIEVIYKEYECGEPGCCYEDWYEIVVDGKPISFFNEYGHELIKRYSSVPYELGEMIEDITGIQCDVEFKHEGV